MPRANAVSRMLSDAGKTKNSSSATRIKGFRIYRTGFRCTNREDGSVRVEHDMGESLRYASQERRDDVCRTHILEYKEVLVSKYTVDVTKDIFGHPVLSVRDKPKT